MYLLEQLGMIADRQPREPLEQLQGSVNPRLAGRLLGRSVRNRIAANSVVQRIPAGRVVSARLSHGPAWLRLSLAWLRLSLAWLRVVSARLRLVLHPLHHSFHGPRGHSGHAATASLNATARRRQAVAPGNADVPPVAWGNRQDGE
jgi:hypothetical protein